MTLITALEIFGNPLDLVFTIGPTGKGTGCFLTICRGPGHHFKVMLSGTLKSKSIAIKAVKELLETSFKLGMRELPSFGGDARKCLNEKQIEAILTTLEKNGECKTHEKGFVEMA